MEDKSISKEDLQAIIRHIKRKVEEEFQAYLKTLTPEEREKAEEFANNML